jgi:hypothetical protein
MPVRPASQPSRYQHSLGRYGFTEQNAIDGAKMDPLSELRRLPAAMRGAQCLARGAPFVCRYVAARKPPASFVGSCFGFALRMPALQIPSRRRSRHAIKETR